MAKKRFQFTRMNRKTKKIENAGFATIRDTAEGADLHFYGDIVSTTWEAWSDEDKCPQDIADFLNQLPDDGTLTVYFNSGGGDVFAGIAIYNALKGRNQKKVGVVEGLAASIASVILMACDEIYVNTGAQIMMHKPLCMAWGNADDFLKVIEQLDMCQQSITDIYMTKAAEGVTEEEIEEKINRETWLNAEMAAEVFDIGVKEVPAMAACASWYSRQYKNRPEGFEEISLEELAAKDSEQQEEKKKELMNRLFMYGI